MGWVIEISKTLGYALAISLLFVFLRTMIGLDNSKATAWGAVRLQGYGVMMVGFFTLVLGFVITRLDMVLANGRTHFILR